MDEDIAIINQNTKIHLIKSFFKRNIIKILIIITIFIIILITIFAFGEIKKRKKNNIAQIYNSVIFNSDNYSNTEIKEKMINIINSKVDTYSTLALYYLIDNNLINENDKIEDLFDLTISITKDFELKNLIIFKKGLYFSDKLTENELLNILRPIISSDSIWKQHGLLLIGDFYYQKKKFNKAKEFFQKIIELNNVNPKLKIDVEKRLNRDFSE